MAARRSTGPARRIVLMTNHIGAPGTNPQLMHLALFLKSAGDDVRVVTLWPWGEQAEELRAEGIEVHLIRRESPLRFVPAVLSTARTLRKGRTDALLTFLYEANQVGRVAARLARVPVVISTIHNEYFGSRTRERLLRTTDRLASMTTTNSRMVAESLIGRGIVPRGRITVIPNALDLAIHTPSEEVRPRVRARLALEDDEFVWLAVGRLTYQKDYPALLRAFRALADQQRSRLLIVGKGPLLEELTGLANDFGVSERVTFLGFRRDVPDLMAAADALVLSSTYEGLPNVIMEALAAGLPVVATDVGGVRELVQHDVSGFIVPPHDVGAVSDAMSRMMSTPATKRASMGGRGREWISQNNDANHIMPLWTELIDRCLNGSHGVANV